ncbi:MAG: O-methyltransferase [Erysipelotrichaceae bacterium]|nr:O-methyltransferase [Erysipelotrichaceae bacterium]
METNILEKIKQKALEDSVPIIEDDGLDFMLQFIENEHIKSILEIGTAVGYSSICFCGVDDEITVYSIEKDEERYCQAVKNIADCELSDRITVVNADARTCKVEGKFDLIFLDGPKAHNAELLARYEKNLNDNGYFAIDDVYFHGYVDNPGPIRTKRMRALVRKLTEFQNDLMNDPRYECTYIRTGDGILIARKRG